MTWLNKAAGQAGQFSEIRGLSEVRRLPRLGKIRLGEVRKNAEGKEYPFEFNYFFFDEKTVKEYPQIREVYGEQPTELDIVFPVEDRRLFFPQALKCWGSTVGVKCRGNNEFALRNICSDCFERVGRALTTQQIDAGYGLECRCERKDREMVEIECPCTLLNKKRGLLCKQTASLQVILPKISPSGIWQCDTSSANSMIDINSGVDYIRGMCGRVAFVPCKLKRVAKITHEGGVKATHYPLIVLADFENPAMRMVQSGTKVIDFFLEPPAEDEERLAIEAPNEQQEQPGEKREGTPVPGHTLPPDAPAPSTLPASSTATKPAISTEKKKRILELRKVLGLKKGTDTDTWLSAHGLPCAIMTDTEADAAIAAMEKAAPKPDDATASAPAPSEKEIVDKSFAAIREYLNEPTDAIEAQFRQACKQVGLMPLTWERATNEQVCKLVDALMLQSKVK